MAEGILIVPPTANEKGMEAATANFRESYSLNESVGKGYRISPAEADIEQAMSLRSFRPFSSRSTARVAWVHG